MGREILFKAKDKENGKWVEGWLLKDEITGQYFIHACGNSVNKSDKVNEEGCLRFVAFEVDENTICQYTGVKDKNGNRVFENDIVKLKFRDGRIGSTEREYNHVVRYDDFEASWEFEERKDLDLLGHPMLTQCNQHIYEVIGNIFDNPELVKGNEYDSI